MTGGIELPMEKRALARASLELAANTILAFCGFVLVYYLCYLHPVGYVNFITEDYWAEHATFVSLAMASCFLAWTLFTHRGARTPGVFLLALGTFVVAMEEISWGQRILGIHTPRFFAARNPRGEMNLHNFFPASYSLHLVAGIAVLVWSILLPLLVRKSMRLRRWCSHLGIPIVPIPLWPFFLLSVYFFINTSLRKSEVGELYLGIALAALSLDLALTTRRGIRIGGAMATGATGGMILTVWIFTSFLVRFYPWPAELTRNLNKFASSWFPAVGMYRQAEALFDYMDRNPRFLLADTHFEHGVLLIRMGRHAKAREVLQVALSEQERLQGQDREDPVPYRIAGQVLRMLARPKDATRAFQKALENDQVRLELANDVLTKAWIHWSLGLTLHAMRDSEAAFKEFSMARRLAPDRRTQHQMDVRIKWWQSGNAPRE